MGWFDWFRRRANRPAQPPIEPTPAPELVAPGPESAWDIGCDGDLFWMIDRDGRRHEVLFSQLHGIAIETNASGPVGMDFWWLIYGPEEDIAFAFPQGATGEAPVIERITALPGFRHEAFQAAIGSTDEDTFVVWQRPVS